MYYADTTIERLFESRAIDVRTYNALRRAGLHTLGDVVAAYPERSDMLRLAGFGRKCLSNITEVLRRTNLSEMEGRSGAAMLFERERVERNEAWERMLREEHAVLTAGGDDVSAFLRERYPQPRDIHAAVLKSDEALLVPFDGRPRRLNRGKSVALRQRYCRFTERMMERMRAAQMEDSVEYDGYGLTRRMLEHSMEVFSPAEEVRYFFSDKQRAMAKAVYIQLRSVQTVRLCNFLLHYLPTLDAAMEYVGRPKGCYRVQPSACARKTIEEMSVFIEALGAEMKRIAQLSDDEVMRETVRMKHPFLDDDRCAMVCRHVVERGVEPRFLLLYHYLRTSSHNGDAAWSMCNGVADGQLHSREHVASDMLRRQITPERVRQLCARERQSLHERVLRYVDGFVDDYKALLSKPILHEGDSVCREICEREGLDIAFAVFARLVTLVADYKVYDVEGHSFLVASSVDDCDDVNVKYYIDGLKRLREERTSKERTVDPVDLIKLNTPRRYKSVVRDMILYLAGIYGIEVTADGKLSVRQNSIDVESELYDILKRNGKPMSGQALLDAFKARYPDHRYDRVDQLRPYLIRRSRIRPIGKSSCYALSEWKMYCGTKTDLLVATLAAAATPLSLDTLCGVVEEHCGEQKERNVASLMSNDERFVRYGDDLFGLAAKDYGEAYAACRFVHRHTFDERIEQLKSFIAAHGRLPRTTGDGDEQSLRRWLYNVKKGVIKVSDAQQQLLDSVKASA